VASPDASACVDSGGPICGPVELRQEGGAPFAPAVEVAAGGFFACARMASGDVWCWGGDLGGQFANPLTLGATPVPELATYLKEYGVMATEIQAGPGSAAAIDSKGGVWAWGLNPYGELGPTDLGTMVRLQHIAGLPGVVTLLSPGYGFTLARTRDNGVWAWGANSAGQLGHPPGMGDLDCGLGTLVAPFEPCQPTPREVPLP